MRLVAQQADRHCFAQKQARLTVRAPVDACEIASDPQLPSSDAASGFGMTKLSLKNHLSTVTHAPATVACPRRKRRMLWTSLGIGGGNKVGAVAAEGGLHRR
jgi:hypothetical protein